MKKILYVVLAAVLFICSAVSAQEAGYEETVISIDGGEYEIPATVCMPAGDGPFPAVVMLHGTGSNREEAGNGYLYAAPVLAEKYGIATIRIDFPGNGDSTADYMQYNFKSAVADAKAAAIQAMESLGFSDFRIAEANPTNLLSGIGGQRSIGAGWSFVFLRDYGYPLLRRYAASSFLSFDETGSAAYRAPLYEEHIEVFADESGVRFLSVFNPRKLLGTENENVSLLPFSEVLARLKDVIRFGLSEYAGNDSIRPEIYEAVLTTHTVPIRNSDAYYVLPVWVFLLDPTGYMPHDERITREAVILNAIDGSVILPDR